MRTIPGLPLPGIPMPTLFIGMPEILVLRAEGGIGMPEVRIRVTSVGIGKEPLQPGG